jgi:hypothetical protein
MHSNDAALLKLINLSIQVQRVHRVSELQISEQKSSSRQCTPEARQQMQGCHHVYKLTKRTH